MEDLNELLELLRLMRDDLWSFVTCRGLLAETEQGVHPLWLAAVETGSVLNVPIKQLVNVKKIVSCYWEESLDCRKFKCVFHDC